MSVTKKHQRIHVGLRTIKTALAVIVSMAIVNLYGTTSSKLIFAMLGAMAAVQPTFNASLESCFTQITGVVFGALVGVLLIMLPISSLAAAGIGIVMVITLYNMLHIHYTPDIPCFIMVLICTTDGIRPITYALGRIWDTTIGLSIGMLINTLIFPLDNSQRIRALTASLNEEVIRFLEDLFDGDDILPDSKGTEVLIHNLEKQLSLFSNQKLFLKLKRQKQELEVFRLCERKAKVLLARIGVLSNIPQPGRLSEENRTLLISCGANIPQIQSGDKQTELDIVTNYHVKQILQIRQELLSALES